MAKWIEDPQGRLEVEKVTEEIKLPVWKANYKGKFREFWNECWEKIEDSFLKLKKSNEGKEPAIEDKQTAFNKAFGTVEDTVLEGNKFTQMTGKDYGGILNIAGQKEAGKAYWDNNTKKLYICKNNNSDISPNINNYIPFDNGSILERLENLFTTKEEKTKLSLAQINNVNLNTITEPGFYTSSGWSNNIVNLPAELNHNEGRAFYLLVFALENGAYCQQILYSFKGLIFYRAITGANSAFTQWKKLT